MVLHVSHLCREMPTAARTRSCPGHTEVTALQPPEPTQTSLHSPSDAGSWGLHRSFLEHIPLPKEGEQAGCVLVLLIQQGHCASGCREGWKTARPTLKPSSQSFCQPGARPQQPSPAHTVPAPRELLPLVPRCPRCSRRPH